jgi:hypothetical protein
MPTVGQTGSGKSYTMMGYGEMGLIPRICSGIFDRAAKELIKEPDSSFVAEVGYLEIYNEKVCAHVCARECVCVCVRFGAHAMYLACAICSVLFLFEDTRMRMRCD